MSDTATPSDVLAAKSIDVNDPAQMTAWATELDLSEERLREVIEMIGPMTAAIRFYVASPKFRSGNEAVAS